MGTAKKGSRRNGAAGVAAYEQPPASVEAASIGDEAPPPLVVAASGVDLGAEAGAGTRDEGEAARLQRLAGMFLAQVDAEERGRAAALAESGLVSEHIRAQVVEELGRAAALAVVAERNLVSEQLRAQAAVSATRAAELGAKRSELGAEKGELVKQLRAAKEAALAAQLNSSSSRGESEKDSFAKVLNNQKAELDNLRLAVQASEGWCSKTDFEVAALEGQIDGLREEVQQLQLRVSDAYPRMKNEWRVVMDRPSNCICHLCLPLLLCLCCSQSVNSQLFHSLLVSWHPTDEPRYAMNRSALYGTKLHFFSLVCL